MDEALLETGQVKHRREDGFRFRPPEPVDWMVCDMVESPSRVCTLAARWVAEGWCRETIFNLKLPMKKRWEEVQRARGIVEEAMAGAPVPAAHEAPLPRPRGGHGVARVRATLSAC